MAIILAKARVSTRHARVRALHAHEVLWRAPKACRVATHGAALFFALVFLTMLDK
jgi:hypothetical protein